MLARLARSSPAAIDAGLLIVRLWFGAVLALGHGWNKLMALGTFIARLAEREFPMPTVFGIAAALSEVAGGLLLALGLVSRVAAGFVLVTMLTAAFWSHAADPFAKKELALAYAAAALAILIAGPGRFSLDAWLFGRRKR